MLIGILPLVFVLLAALGNIDDTHENHYRYDAR
jgi:hypothetical protein